ncbi:MAG: MFS transporter [Methanobrevibacter sp.]|nr:MFS transporter [Methanobrevibacter sp.]
MGSRLENYVLFVTTLTTFFIIFLSTAVMIAIPTISNEFGMSNIVQNWINTIYLLAIVVFTIPAGQISAKYGLKKTMVIGLIVFTITSAIIMFSSSQDMFLILRIFQAIGASFLTVASTALLVSAFKAENRGKALGINVIGIFLAACLSPIIGGFLNNSYGWRSIFLVTLPFLVVCLILLITKINKEWKTLEDVSIDIKGIILCSVGILLFVFGFTTLNLPFGFILVILGILVLVLFYFVERNMEHPVFNVNLFKNPKFLTSNIATLCAFFALSAILTIVNYHLQYIRGFNSQEAGFIILIAPVVQVVLSPIAGRMSDKINPQKLAAVGATIGGVGIAIIATVSNGTPIEVLMLAFFLLGLGFGLFSSPNTNAIMGSVPKKETSMASASYSTVRVVGQTMSMGTFTFIFSIIMGNVAIVPSNFHLLVLSSQITATICAIVCFVSAIVSVIGFKSKGYYNA